MGAFWLTQAQVLSGRDMQSASCRALPSRPCLALSPSSLPACPSLCPCSHLEQQDVVEGPVSQEPCLDLGARG